MPNFCLTSSISTHISDLEAIRGLDHSNDIFYLKIYIHVLRKETAPKLGQTIEDVNRQLKYLYDDFDPLGIHFVWDNWIDYIENNEYFDDVDEHTADLLDTNSHSDGIDIYFFDSEKGYGSIGFGLANDIGGSALMVGGAYRGYKDGGERTPYSWRKIISHEMGHVLFLFHTHHGTWVQQYASCDYETGPDTCPELVDGSNSATCGDYITDTPADPVIGWQVNYNTCEYQPTFNPNDCIPDYDANGHAFQPDTSNLMSYTYPTCLDGFTFGQRKRMKNAIWYLPVLNNTLLNDYTYIRADSDCFVCEDQYFYVYSTKDLNHLYPISSANVTTQIIEQTADYIKVRVTNNDPTADEGERGDFSIVVSGRGMIVAA